MIHVRNFRHTELIVAYYIVPWEPQTKTFAKILQLSKVYVVLRAPVSVSRQSQRAITATFVEMLTWK